jgi:hypothetical protein
MKSLEITSTSTSMRERCYNDAARFAAGGDDIEPAQKFDWFITGHVSESQQVNIQRQCKHFRNKLDGLIYGRRHRLYKMLWIEEGAQLHSKATGTAHAHWVFEHPQHLSADEFELLFTQLWTEICGSTNVDIRPINTNAGGIDGIINYCVKEAEHRNFGTFIEICSDNARSQKNRQTFIHPSLLKSS